MNNTDAPLGTAEPAAEAAAPHRCHVLIVDDTGASRVLLAGILRSFGGNLQLHECRNGADALAVWPQLNPHITLLDIDMPGMDGLAVLKKIHALRADAFVAMVSAGSALENVRSALSLGASGYVVKPYKSQRILDLLHKYRSVSGVDILKP